MRFLIFARRAIATIAMVLALPALAQAQEEEPSVGSAAHHVWYDMNQATCVERGTDAIRSFIDVAGFSDIEIREESWYAVAAWRDLHVWLYCFAGPGSVIDPEADQVLAMFMVSGLNGDSSDIRDFLGDCLNDGVCPTSLGGDEGVAIDWARDALDYAGEVGQVFAFTCPALGNEPLPQIWGSDVYTADSPICAAAVHAGIITTDGGDLSIEIMEGQDEYVSSKRNGMASYPYGSYTSSYMPFPPG